MFGVGRDLCGSPNPTPLPKRGHLQQAAQDLVQASLQYLQRRLHNLPGQPVPVLRPLGIKHTHGEVTCLRSLTSLSYQQDVTKLQVVKVIFTQFTCSTKTYILSQAYNQGFSFFQMHTTAQLSETISKVLPKTIPLSLPFSPNL